MTRDSKFRFILFVIYCNTPVYNLVKSKAKILHFKGSKRLLNFDLNSEKHGGIMEAINKKMETEIYDSQIEQNFASRFKALDTGWTIKREPEPLPVGKYVMIPDFGFKKESLKVLLEVAGFWTPQYLKEKIRKLEQLNNVDLIIAADKKLACQKLDLIGKN